MPRYISEETKANLVDYYQHNLITLEALSERFNVSVPIIIKLLRKNNIKTHRKVLLYSPELREDFFECIDTEEKAYFLGLIISDGCVFKGKGEHILTLTLQDCDRYLLEDFVRIIRCNKKVTRDNRGCSEIAVKSTPIVLSLEKYGVIENKSLKTIFPKNINDDCFRHMLRGLIDGDGSIAFYVRKQRNVHKKAIRLCQGNERFLNDIVDFLSQTINTTRINVYQEKDSLWSISYNRNDDILKIIHFLYDDATIFMKRKREKCDKILLELATPR